MSNRTKKIIKNVAIAFGVLVVGVVGFGVWLSIPGDDTELRAVADKFQADPAWEVVKKDVYPNQKICLGNPCNQASYIWKTPQLVDEDSLRMRAAKSGFNVYARTYCKSSNRHTCSLDGEYDKYTITLYASPPDSYNNSTTVRLSVSGRAGVL